MKRPIGTIIKCFFCFGLFSHLACSSETESTYDITSAKLSAQPNSNSEGEQQYLDSDILPGIEPDEYTCEGSEYTGRLEFMEGTDRKQRKFLLHLEGTHYEMGFQHGYLLAPIVKDAVTKSTTDIVQFYLGSFSSTFSLNAISKSLRNYAAHVKDYMPQKYLNEIWGIVEGVVEGGGIPDTVEDKEELFLDIIVVNIGPDIASAMFNNLILEYPFFYLTYHKPRVRGANYQLSEVHTCDAFVVTGDKATVANKTIMGRNFMYNSEPWWRYGIVAEYYPTDEIPHVGVGMAGLVAIVSGMNSEGIGIGTNLATSLDSAQPLVKGDYEKIGMGAGLAARQALATSKDLKTAIESLENTQLGAPWIFTIADGIRDGDVADDKKIAAAVTKVESEVFTVRYMNDDDPAFLDEKYVHRNNTDDLLVTSNFPLKPEHYDVPVLVHGWARYNEVLSRLNTAIESGGVCFDDGEGCGGDTRRLGTHLVNYLREWEDNPSNKKIGEEGYENNRTVKELMATSVTLFDLSETKMKTKYSKYSHDWVEYDLP